MKKKLKYLIAIICVLLLNYKNVLAAFPSKIEDIQQKGDQVKYTYDKDFGVYLKKTIDNKVVFCTAYSDKSPASRTKEKGCSLISSASHERYWSDDVSAGVAAIINYFKISDDLTNATKDTNYINQTQKHVDSNCKTDKKNIPTLDSSNGNCNSKTDKESCEAQKKAKEAYDKVHNKIKLKSLSQSSSGDYYTVSGVVENAYNSNYTINISGISSSDYQKISQTSTSFSYRIFKSRLFS